MENLNVDSKEGKDGNAEAKKEKDKEDGSQNPSAEGEVNFCLEAKYVQFCFHPSTFDSKVDLEGKCGEEDDKEGGYSQSNHHILSVIQHASLHGSKILV